MVNGPRLGATAEGHPKKFPTVERRRVGQPCRKHGAEAGADGGRNLNSVICGCDYRSLSRSRQLARDLHTYACDNSGIAEFNLH